MNKINTAQFGIRLREAFGGAINAEIARRLKKSNPAIKNYIEGRIPELDVLDDVLVLTGCSLHWLLTGEGEKYVQPSARNDVQSGALASLRISAPHEAPRTPAPIKQNIQLTVGGIVSVIAVDEIGYIAPMRLRDRAPAEVVVVTILDENFVEAGYEPGDQLYCVPYAPTDLRDGDLVIAQDDKQVWIRRYQRRGEFVALKHRFNFDLPRVYFPEDLKLLYRVVG